MSPTQQIRFEAAAGVALVGTLTLPEGPGEVPMVIAVHGAQAGARDFFLYQHLTGLLDPIGVGTLVYDRRGEGESTGEAISPIRNLA